MFCFGLVMTLQGVTTNFAGLAATRFFLGLCEAGAFPVLRQLTKFNGRVVSICCRCGTNEQKRKNDSHSFSARLPWQVPLAVF